MSQLDDSGFADPGAARHALQRLRLKAALRKTSESIAAFLKVLDQGIDTDGSELSAIPEHRVALRSDDLDRCVGGEAIDGVESQHMREQELLQSVHLGLQLFDALRQITLDHNLFAPVPGSPLASRAADRAHRLSESLK